jgi:WD40 repeat protein
VESLWEVLGEWRGSGRGQTLGEDVSARARMLEAVSSSTARGPTSPANDPLCGHIMLTLCSGHNPDSPVAERIHTAAHSRSCFALSWISGGLPESEGGLGLLASGGGDGKIIIWQVVRPVASSSSAEAGVSATETKTEANTETPTESAATVRMYPVAAVREAHGVSDVNSLAWCPRGEGKGKGLLASCGDDGTVRVWRVVRD